jgi:protein gp37
MVSDLNMSHQNFPNGFRCTLHPQRLDDPKRWRKPSRIFVNSMSDLFHEQIPLLFLQKILQMMEESPQHVFQILTKRREFGRGTVHPYPTPPRPLEAFLGWCTK